MGCSYRDAVAKCLVGGRCERRLPLELERLTVDLRPDLDERLLGDADAHADRLVDAGRQHLPRVYDNLLAGVHQIQTAACCVHITSHHMENTEAGL